MREDDGAGLVEQGAEMKVVVCGPSALSRSRISGAVEEAGGSVIVETDMAFEAANVAERFSADVMVLDLDAHLALGQHPLDDLERPDRTYHVIISVDLPGTIDSDRPQLTVVSRERAALINALARLTDERGPERRRVPQATRQLPKGTENLSSHDVFFTALSDAQPGDVLIMVTMADRTELDHLARVCSEQVRATDYVLRQSSEVVVFLPGGDGERGRAALDRVGGQWPDATDLIIRFSVVDDVPAAELFSSELRALRAGHRPEEFSG